MSRSFISTVTHRCDRCGFEQTEPYANRDYQQQGLNQHESDPQLPAQWGLVSWSRHCLRHKRELCPDCLETCHAVLTEESP